MSSTSAVTGGTTASFLPPQAPTQDVTKSHSSKGIGGTAPADTSQIQTTGASGRLDFKA